MLRAAILLILTITLTIATAIPVQSIEGNYQIANLSSVLEVKNTGSLHGNTIVVVRFDPFNPQSGFSMGTEQALIVRKSWEKIHLYSEYVWLILPKGEPGNLTLYVVLRYNATERIADITGRALSYVDGVSRVVVIMDDVGVTKGYASTGGLEVLVHWLSPLIDNNTAVVVSINGVPAIYVVNSEMDRALRLVSEAFEESGITNMSILIIETENAAAIPYTISPLYATGSPMSPTPAEPPSIVPPLSVIFSLSAYVPAVLVAFAALIGGIVLYKILS